MIISRDLIQALLENVIVNIGQIGSNNLGKRKLDMHGYLGG